jgi:acyl dehydratase
MLEQLTSPLELQDQNLGPVEVALTADRIAFYVDATRDDIDRWVDEAPPGFAAVLLFAVADLFLYHPNVVPFTATLLHLDQTFEYFQPMRANSTIVMAGTITRVRERAGSYFVTFDATGTDAGVDVVRSVSTFVLSDQKAPQSGSVRIEPSARERGSNTEGLRSASRHDLVRYAAASRDFNPLHWDHDVAVEAGLSGTVAHGLLMYAWMMQEASRSAGGASIVRAKVRFRSALHPGQQAAVEAVRDGHTVTIVLTRGDEQLVTGTATVRSDTE